MTIELCWRDIPHRADQERGNELGFAWGTMGRWDRLYLLPWGLVHEIGKEGLPPWPEPADFGITYELIEQAEYDEWKHGTPLPEDVQPYLKAQHEVLSYAPEVPGIPAWKIRSNDNWIIGPVECLGAVHNWRQHGSPVPDNEHDVDRFAAFIEFLTDAAEHDGIRVS